MGKFTGKQKGVIGFVAAVLAAAAYFFSMTMGWVPNWLADEPEAKPAAEQVAPAADAAKDAKPAVEAKAKEVKPLGNVIDVIYSQSEKAPWRMFPPVTTTVLMLSGR